jgi:hypothetical protein
MRTYKKRTAKLGNNDELTIKLIITAIKPKTPESRGKIFIKVRTDY